MGRALALATALVVLAGCGGAASPSPAASSSASPAASVAASPAASVAASPSPSASPAEGASVPWDESLLDVLPAAVGALALAPERDSFAASASSADLVRDVEAGAVGLVVDPATGDYAVAFAYRLKPGVFDDAWFRAWRDSFDEAVCEQAGGVTGHAEAEIGGRPTYIGSCSGGVRTYHALLDTDGGDIVVSVQSFGSARLGEQVMAGLRT